MATVRVAASASQATSTSRTTRKRRRPPWRAMVFAASALLCPISAGVDAFVRSGVDPSFYQGSRLRSWHTLTVPRRPPPSERHCQFFFLYEALLTLTASKESNDGNDFKQKSSARMSGRGVSSYFLTHSTLGPPHASLHPPLLLDDERQAAIVSKLAKEGYLKQAVKLLSNLKAPSPLLVRTLLMACVNAESLPLALAVVKMPHVHPSVQQYTLVIKICARQERWFEAVRLLRDMRTRGAPPDLVAYTAVMDCCAKAGQWEAALTLIPEMKEAGVRPDRITYNTAIDACAKGGQWQRALEILRGMEEPNLISYNSALDSCAKTGRWKEAVGLLEEMRQAGRRKDGRGSTVSDQTHQVGANQGNTTNTSPGNRGGKPSIRPNIISYNTAIEACAKRGRFEEALAILRSMQLPDTERAGGHVPLPGASKKRNGASHHRRHQRLAPEPDLVTYHSAIKACGHAGQWEHALSLLAEVRAARWIELEPSTYNAAIAACAKSGRFNEALDLLKECGDASNVVTYNSAMQACSSGGRPDLAFQLLQVMKANGVEPDVVSYTTVMQRSSVDVATSVLNRMRAAGVSVGVMTYNALLNACAREGDWRTSLAMLEEMDHQSVAPNVVSYTLAMEACGRGGQWQAALEVLNEMTVRGVPLDSKACQTAIDVCAKVQDWNKALSLLRDVSAQGRDGIGDQGSGNGGTKELYEKAMAAFGRAGEWEKVLWLLEGMDRPNQKVTNLAMRACAQAGRWEEAVGLLQNMTSKGIAPDQWSYNTAIHACAQAGNAEKALKLLKEMGQEGVVPDVVSYTTAMDACASVGDVETSRRLLEEMVKKGVHPNHRSFNAIMSAHGNAGQATEAIAVLGLMTEHGLTPDVKSYTLAMDVCLRQGLWQVALKIVERMHATRVRFDAISYGKAIHAAHLGEQWEVAVGFLDEMVESGWLPSHKSYTLVVEACRRAGESRLAEEVSRRWARDKESLARANRRSGGKGLADTRRRDTRGESNSEGRKHGTSPIENQPESSRGNKDGARVDTTRGSSSATVSITNPVSRPPPSSGLGPQFPFQTKR